MRENRDMWGQFWSPELREAFSPRKKPIEKGGNSALPEKKKTPGKVQGGGDRETNP